MLSELVYASTSSEGHMMCMDQNLTAFADCLGTCERLVKTPIPLSYTRYDLGKRRRPAWPVWPCNCCLAACGPLANRRPVSPLHNIRSWAVQLVQAPVWQAGAVHLVRHEVGCICQTPHFPPSVPATPPDQGTLWSAGTPAGSWSSG